MFSKKSLITFVVIINIIIAVFLSVNVWAQVEEPVGDEQDTFTSVAPDALIILDLSGSMAWNPAGGDEGYGNSLSCVADTTHCTGSGCTGGFCGSSKTGCNVNCSRVAIAKRALFNILDDDNNNIINDQDALSLQIRIGFMRFYNGDDTAGNYATGNNRLVNPISTLGSLTGTSYQLTYCGSSTSCTAASTCTSNCMAATTAPSGGTPLASSLKEAKKYLDAHKAADTAKGCRQKFVIVITDGADTYACSGDGGECQQQMYKRRREVVAATKQLSDAGYKVFVVGFGATMPAYLQNTLQWMAYYGGSDNPLVTNSGSTTAYNIPIGCNANPAVPAACCDLTTNATACFPAGITSGATSTDQAAQCYNAGVWSSTSHFRATLNDPGYVDGAPDTTSLPPPATALALSGYAFLAGNADQLTQALKSAFGTIRNATYSFTQPSIQAVRTIDENFVYEASFQPVTYDPFWIGHLKRYSINDNGTIKTSADWDAGTVLVGIPADSRSIWTYPHGSLKEFKSGNLTIADLLDVTAIPAPTDADKDAIINYFRGGESNDAVTNWKLGDIFHTSPLSIGSPNPLFYDRWDKSDPKAFNVFRDGTAPFYTDSHKRTTDNGNRIMLIGANDGQLHAFQTTGGSELWSFIPPNFLPKLQSISHTHTVAHPTTNQDHQYFVDGPLSAADIWLGTGTPFDNISKLPGDWHTYLVMAEGRGGNATLWSEHASCDENFNPTYSATYVNYCGYYTFDISNTTATPIFKWRVGNNTLSATDGAHLGQAWSKMYMGRVRINNAEKWVGFIGGGYSGTNCAGAGACGDTRGKGFYVVDLSDGHILWRYTHSDPAGLGNPTDGSMDYNLAAGPIVIDSDSDGFLDTAYIGDLGGNVWRFKFCLQSDAASCNENSWSGGLLFKAQTADSNIRPIHTSAAVSIDQKYNLWVYFGTGDKTDPTATPANVLEKFYAVKDSDRSATYTLGNLVNIGAGTYSDPPTGHGWYFNLASGGEKILAEPVLFAGRVYFTTYMPSSNPCDQGGIAKLYIIDYITGGGKCAGGVRSENIGTGIPSAPVISYNPYGGTDTYVSTSGSTVGAHTTKAPDPNQNPDSPNSLIYWHDLRVQ